MPPTDEAREQQRALYGAPLGELLGRLMATLGLTQGRLAESLGVSAPMLSQLISGQRVKIGNPAVVHRIQALLDLVDDGVTGQSPTLETRLVEIRAEQATLVGSRTDVTSRTTVAAQLARLAGADDLVAAASAVPGSPLAEVLVEASQLAAEATRGAACG